MSEKWTPGPWDLPHFVDDSHPCDCRSITSDSHAGAICTIGVNNGRAIGDGGNDAPPLEEAKANAYLIWAATDMAEALILWAAAEKEELEECRQTGRQIAREKRDAALAKARGEHS